MTNNQDNSVNKINKIGNSTRMPEDFWQMVQQERALAQLQIERRKQSLYQPFTQTQENQSNRIPMPEGFWDAVKADIEVTVSLPPDLFKQEPNQVKAQVQESKSLPLWEYDKEVPIENSINNIDLKEESFIESAIKEPPLEPVVEEEFLQGEPAEVEEHDIIYLEQESTGLTFKEAAIVILSREKRPMTAREIAGIAINEGFVVSAGKTPDASVAGQIYTDIRRYPEKTPFVSAGPRTYALKSFYNLGENFSKATEVKASQDEKGEVISGYFSKQEEKQATKLNLTDSNLALETFNKSTSELPSIQTDKVFLEEESSQTKLIEAQLIGDKGQELEAEISQVVEEGRKMSFKQVAFYLLRRMKRPMTAREIAAIALEESLIDSSSKKPDSSLAGQLYTDFQRFGEKSVFRQVAPRTYGLAEWYK